MPASSAWLRRAGLALGTAVALVGATAPAASAHPGDDVPPPVTTCAMLAAGSVGHAVKTIQTEIGTEADGDFGPNTQAALETWQKTNGVPQTGVVDAATWAALPARVARHACGQKVSGTGVGVTCSLLSVGTTGVAVVVLQRSLDLTRSGDFDASTRTAVNTFQTTNDLTVTGNTSLETWRALHLVGTPACSTKHSVGPHESADAKAQAKIRAAVDVLAAKLIKKPGTSTSQIALQAMAFAKKQVGKPYVYGATGPKGYDCSGLQMASYLHAGISIPRVAADQYAGAGVAKPLNHARQGDLLFYASDVTQPTTVYHVAMYIGGGQMLDAPHTGADVEVTSLRTTDLLPIVIRPVAALTLPLRRGDSGWTVTQLQQDLVRLGSNLTVDGGYGHSTEKAVRAWQRAHDLPASGVVDVDTWLTLG